MERSSTDINGTSAVVFENEASPKLDQLIYYHLYESLWEGSSLSISLSNSTPPDKSGISAAVQKINFHPFPLGKKMNVHAGQSSVPFTEIRSNPALILCSPLLNI